MCSQQQPAACRLHVGHSAINSVCRGAGPGRPAALTAPCGSSASALSAVCACALVAGCWLLVPGCWFLVPGSRVPGPGAQLRPLSSAPTDRVKRSRPQPAATPVFTPPHPFPPSVALQHPQPRATGSVVVKVQERQIRSMQIETNQSKLRTEEKNWQGWAKPKRN